MLIRQEHPFVELNYYVATLTFEGVELFLNRGGIWGNFSVAETILAPTLEALEYHYYKWNYCYISDDTDVKVKKLKMNITIEDIYGSDKRLENRKEVKMMKKEYTLQETLERIELLERENKEIKEELENTKKELAAKSEIVEQFEAGKQVLQSMYERSKAGTLWDWARDEDTN